MNKDVQMREQLAALEHIAAATGICDAIGESLVACHLQPGVDLLRSGFEEAALPQAPARSLQ